MTMPFYVPIGKGKLNLHTGIRGGYYLPATEPLEEVIEHPTTEPLEVKHIYHHINPQTNKVAYLLKKVVELDKEILELRSIKKKPKSYKYTDRNK